MDELHITVERAAAPRRARRLAGLRIARELESPSLDHLWSRLLDRPYLAPLPAPDDVDAEEAARVLAEAEAACARRIDVLGSGRVELGRPIDWLADVKSGRRWPAGYAPRIDYVDTTDDSDVKIAWELSRLLWLLPAGQAYVLTGEERYAASVRDVLDEWIASNPYAWTVNWSVAMEPALRIVSWTWLFHACGKSAAWSETGFRERFLVALYLHGDYVARHLEWSEVRGNHFTADAAGLAIAGLFFGDGDAPRRWAVTGWELLEQELPLQVHDDGVDFEASAAYHRLVAELFLLPALHRRRLGLDVPGAYRARLATMGRFTLAYTRPDGTSPAWGDDDDARALPLGGFVARDHRYLPGVIGAGVDVDDLRWDLGAPRTEALWLLGADAAQSLRAGGPPPGAVRFDAGGAVVLAGARDHVFVDCGDVGLAGRGGHGHNDCLSFEAVLDCVPVVVDPGTYVYTASPTWRNRFRSTRAHNTPLVDGAEQGRLDPESLWRIEPDATGEILDVAGDAPVLRFRGAHRGYARLAEPVTVLRSLELDVALHRLAVMDELEGRGEHDVRIPLQLARGVEAVISGPGRVAVSSGRSRFELTWGEASDWLLGVTEGWVSPRYGRREPAPRLEWRRQGSLRPLRITIAAVNGTAVAKAGAEIEAAS